MANTPVLSPPNDPGLVQIEDTPGLPRVLILGDSISMGYTPVIRQLLHGKANIHHPPENCADSATGLQKIDAWLGQKPWHVVHFNFGLHDVKHLGPSGAYVHPTAGKKVATVEQYKSNMATLVSRLQKTSAKLIWCSTTPIPENARARIQADEVPINAAAAQIMAAHNIPITDLWSVVTNNPALQLPHDVHFTPEGYAALAQSVTAAILPHLSK